MKIERPAPGQPIPPEAKCVFKGVIFDVYQWQQKMFDGTTATFERAKRPDTAVVIPMTQDGQVIVLEEEQPGAKLSVNFPGGRIDPAEDPFKAAARELLEETGYASDQELLLWEAIQPVAKIDWAVYTFIARDCRKVAESKSDAGEKIKMKFLRFEDLFDTTVDLRRFGQETEAKFLRAKHDPAKMAKLKKLFGLA